MLEEEDWVLGGSSEAVPDGCLAVGKGTGLPCRAFSAASSLVGSR